MMEDLKITNREKMEDLLVDIYRNSKCRSLGYLPQEVVYGFDARLSEDIYCTGKYHEGHQMSSHHAEIEIDSKYGVLAKIATKYGFIDQEMPGWISGGKVRAEVAKPVKHTTLIEVTSPQWKPNDGVATTKDNLRILRAKSETDDAVIDRICAVVAQSKDQTEVTVKLTTLNIDADPSDLLSANTDATNDREM